MVTAHDAPPAAPTCALVRCPCVLVFCTVESVPSALYMSFERPHDCELQRFGYCQGKGGRREESRHRCAS